MPDLPLIYEFRLAYAADLIHVAHIANHRDRCADIPALTRLILAVVSGKATLDRTW